ncbi:MAG: hypothetical protein NW237_10140 [Cyanobacteriota bacterium]|nr:hypothetical protein [Cyanobacteriota bacterium]
MRNILSRLFGFLRRPEPHPPSPLPPTSGQSLPASAPPSPQPPPQPRSVPIPSPLPAKDRQASRSLPPRSIASVNPHSPTNATPETTAGVPSKVPHPPSPSGSQAYSPPPQENWPEIPIPEIFPCDEPEQPADVALLNVLVAMQQKQQRQETQSSLSQSSAATSSDLPDLLDVLANTSDQARQKAEGFKMTDALILPDQHRQLVNWITRRGQVTLAEVAVRLQQPEDETGSLLHLLIEQGFLQRCPGQDSPTYRPRLAPKRGPQLSSELWKAID